MPTTHIFLSYCHDNRAEVEQLRMDLIAAGEAVWWDRDIAPGKEWEQEIRQAMAASYAVVVCLSKELEERQKSGVYSEIIEAIAEYRTRKSGMEFIFPVRLSACGDPANAIGSLRQLKNLQHVDLFPAPQRADGFTRLIDSFANAPGRSKRGSSGDNTGGHTYAPVRKKVFLSSNLMQQMKEHHKPMEDACLRMDCTPLACEVALPIDESSLELWLRQMDEAEIYVGVFAHQYGKPLAGGELSLIELEYDRAGERKIPRLVFLQDEEVPVPPKDVEKGPGADKLQRFKQRIATDGCKVAEFKNVADLRAKVIEALQRFREPRPAAFHYVSDIPAPPEVYVAHPYTLLQTRGLVGRQEELNWLTDWVAKRGSRPFDSRMFFLVAIGGQGKSALTWDWFQRIAEQEMKPLAGRMWWSFYESDASFENFVTRALAYVTRKPLDEIRKVPPPEREDWLLRVLDHEPHLLVLDGLERVLLAYSGANVSRLQDDELDRATANYVAQAYGLPETAQQSFTGQHRLRLTADPRVGSFLRKLTQVRAARILVSTRLFPSDLQMANGEAMSSCFAYFLTGLSDNDALELWRGFGAKGSRETLLPMLASFDKHPLLIQALASVVAHDRRAVGDFDAWHKRNPDFNPFKLLDGMQRKSHVLSHALRGLDEQQLRLLQTIAAFRMPTTYETLVALFVKVEGGGGKAEEKEVKNESSQSSSTLPLPPSAFTSEPALDAALTTLEDRGLLGWDRRANRYDLHPIVRGVVWSALDTARRRDVCGTLHEHFAPIEVPDFENVESLDDLTPAIELFHTLIELERYEDAFHVFRDRLNDATLYRLSASRVRIELVERLFPDGLGHPPRLSAPAAQSHTLNALALAYDVSGQPGAAVPVFRRMCEVAERQKDQSHISVALCNLSDAQRMSGDVRAAEASARAVLLTLREERNEFLKAVGLYQLGLVLAVRSAARGI
ncbi:MAG: TIR domain-containing protein, partial [Planctomycetota bacterium]